MLNVRKVRGSKQLVVVVRVIEGFGLAEAAPSLELVFGRLEFLLHVI